MWKKYHSEILGTAIEGDRTSPPTRWWNHIFLVLWGWKTVTVFGVSEEAVRIGYRVGYRPLCGQSMVEDRISHEPTFRMRVGHEACTFFAVTADGQEIPLQTVGRTVKNDPNYKNAPLH